MELVKVIFDTIIAGARGIGKIFTEGAPILLEMIKTAAELVLNGHLLKSKDTFPRNQRLYIKSPDIGGAIGFFANDAWSTNVTGS